MRLLPVLIVGLTCIAPVNAQAPAKSGATFAALSAQADAAREAGRLADAATLYRRALAKRPDWGDGWWSLGTILYDQDSYALAAAAFRRLLAIDAKNGTANLMLGLCEYQLNRDDSALSHIRRAKTLGVQADEQLVRVLHYHEGMLLLRKGRFDDAIEATKPLVEKGVASDELDALLGASVLLLRPEDLPRPNAPELQIVLRAGRAERNRLGQQWDAANAGYAALAQEFPVFPNVHYAFGRFLLALERPEEAIEQFTREIENQPRHVRARMQIAAAYYRVDSPAGIPYAKEVVAMAPGYPFGHYLLGLLYLDTRSIPLAIQELEAAARMVPTEPQFQFSLGSAYARAGRPKDAARARAAFAKLGGTHPPGSGEGNEPPRLDLDQPR